MIVFFAFLALLTPVSGTSYEVAIASAHASGACYVEQTPSGWAVVQDCDDSQ